MIINVSTLAELKHHETGYDEALWAQVVEGAHLSLTGLKISPFHLEALTRASRSPKQLITLIRLIYQYGKSYPNGARIVETLLSTANQSQFTLTDWVDSIERFQIWLIQNQRKSNLLSMINYVDCCANSTEGQRAQLTLSTILEQMLRTYGYEGRDP